MHAQPYQPPTSSDAAECVYCRYCAGPLTPVDNQCPQCGAKQNLNAKNKVLAGLLALFLGGLGIHRFYLGQWWGVFYLLFYWTGIPSIASFIEAIVFLCRDRATWLAKYGNVKHSSLFNVFLGVLMSLILATTALAAYATYVAYVTYQQRLDPLLLQPLERTY